MELETSTNIIKLDSPTISSSNIKVNNEINNFENNTNLINQSTKSSNGNLESTSISNGILSSQMSNIEVVQTTSQTETLVPVAESPKLFSTLPENFNNQINSNNLPESSSNGIGIEQMTSQTMNAADQALLLTENTSNVTNPVVESASIGVSTNLEQMTTSQTEISTSNQTTGNVEILGRHNETSQNVTTDPVSESSRSITDFAAQQVANESISSESTPNLKTPMPETTISNGVQSQIAPIPGVNAINDPEIDSGISNSMPDFTSVEDSDLLPGLNHPIEPLPELSDQRSHLDEPLQVEHQNLDGGADEEILTQTSSESPISNVTTLSTRR